MSKKNEVSQNRQFFHKLFKIISAVLVLAIIIVSSVYLYGKIHRLKLKKVQNNVIPEIVKQILTNPETKIKSIDNLQEVSGVYQFILILETNGKNSHYVAHMTKDGKFVFPSYIKIDDIKDMKEIQNSATPSAAPANINEQK